VSRWSILPLSLRERVGGTGADARCLEASAPVPPPASRKGSGRMLLVLIRARCDTDA
jgi:hypothetical protein